MDREWIRNPNRVSREYLNGISEFLKTASKHVNAEGYTKCPCQNCNNCRLKSLREIQQDLGRYGMSFNYTTWTHHGERLRTVSSCSNPQPVSRPITEIGSDNDHVMNVINDLHPHTHVSQNNALEEDDNTISNDNVEVDESSMPREEHEKFERLLKQAQRELYPGCEGFSVLTAIVEFMHGKVMFGMSNTCYDYFMALFKRMLPKDNVLPPSHYEADKILKDLGLGCEKIHACKYDCVLFYKENKALDQCPVCNEPRYHKSSPDKKRKIPRKVLRYFPLKPRLQRLYMSVHTANDMRWHKETRVDDDVMRHPADGTAWKEFDNIYPDFAADPRT